MCSPEWARSIAGLTPGKLPHAASPGESFVGRGAVCDQLHIQPAIRQPAPYWLHETSALFCAPVLLWSRPHAQDVLNAWATAPHALVKFTTARQSRALHRPTAACSAWIAVFRPFE